MKRKLCVWLLALCLVTTFAAAESVLDLSGYTDTEIETLLTQVQTEIVSRGIEKTADLMAGQYVGGEDIPAGEYILLCKTDSDHHGIVWVSAADDDLQSQYPSILYEHISFDKEESFRVVLEEGGILNLPFAAQLQIYAGVVFK